LASIIQIEIVGPQSKPQAIKEKHIN